MSIDGCLPLPDSVFSNLNSLSNNLRFAKTGKACFKLSITVNFTKSEIKIFVGTEPPLIMFSCSTIRSLLN